MQLAPGVLLHLFAGEVLLKKRSKPRRGLRPRPIEADLPSTNAKSRGALAPLVLSVLAGLAISVAWLITQTIASAVLGWVSACLFVVVLRSWRKYWPAYCAGVVTCTVGFSWIYGTVASFGDFGSLLGALALFLFVTISAIQFLILAFAHHQLSDRFDALALRAPTALVISELVSIRLFYWHFGHTQIAFTPFVQVAGLGGAMLVSFLMFWLAEAAVRVIVFRERRWAFVLPVVAFGFAVGYGTVITQRFATIDGEALDVVLVQQNAPVRTVHDPEANRLSIERHNQLSQSAAPANSLVVWPEGAIPVFLPRDVGRARPEVPVFPTLGNGAAFIVGSYCEDAAHDRFNAAYAIAPDGTFLRPYFKQVLIPFGEMIPFSDIFPWLKRLNSQAGVFTPGKEVMVFDLPIARADGSTFTVKAAPLICYEDTVPALSRKATRKGAELLVNLTYDTWFGHSAAPFEHHLIAAFRAIENRRYLVRATNSGFSAVVDPLGRSVASIPAFTEGTAVASVKLLNVSSLYTSIGDRPWWALFIVAVIAIVVRRWTGSATAAEPRAASA